MTLKVIIATMMVSHMKHSLNPKGFTLIEMIIVISIISLLSTVGSSSFTNVLRNARDTKRRADLNEFVKAVKLYQVHHHQGPTEIGWCQSSIGNYDGGDCPPPSPTYQWQRNQTWTDLVTGGYLEELPIDPVNSTAHYYWFEPNNPPPNNGGWIRARLESTNSFYYVFWDAP